MPSPDALAQQSRQEGGAEPRTSFDRLIFEQELNEVYLLLDFISGRPDRRLASAEIRIPNPYFEKDRAEAGRLDKFAAEETLSLAQAIERVSILRYPPKGSDEDRGRDAAFLLILKDALNTIAAPARGMTIAYTTMFTAKSWQSTLQRSKINRLTVAESAYPSLANSAMVFRLMKNTLSWVGLGFTIIISLALWQATYGVQLTDRFFAAKSSDALAAAAIYEQYDAEQPDSNNASPDIHALCRISPPGSQAENSAPAQNIPPAAAPPVADNRTIMMRKLCDEYAFTHAEYCVVIADVGSYNTSYLFRFARSLLPIHTLKPGACGDGEPPSGRQEDVSSIAGVLKVVTNYLLPICFGFIGALTALVRSIQNKVSESVLEPRDKTLALIQLSLGMIAGACVGLFFNPLTLSSQGGGAAGVLTLSASGVGFLAGYGAEAFFKALDNLVTKIFPRATATPAGPAIPGPRK